MTRLKYFYSTESSKNPTRNAMIPVLQKVAQLNVLYKKMGGPIMDVCTGAPSDEVTALVKRHFFECTDR